MSFSFRIKSPGKTIKNLFRRHENFINIARREYVLGADRFISEIRTKYYSGQKGDVGVNKISGDLRRNWFPSVTVEGKEVVATIENTMNYAVAHEFGTSIHRKRTFVTEEMHGGIGDRIFTDSVRIALKEAF